MAQGLSSAIAATEQNPVQSLLQRLAQAIDRLESNIGDMQSKIGSVLDTRQSPSAVGGALPGPTAATTGASDLARGLEELINRVETAGSVLADTSRCVEL